MLRLLVVIGVVIALWLLLRRYWPAPRRRSLGDGDYRRMVACRHCGVHVPVDEAISYRDGTYCCRAHLPE